MVLGLDAGIMLVAILIAVAALIIVVNAIIIPEIGKSFVDIALIMPKFNYATSAGIESGNSNFETYSNLRTISFIIGALAMSFAAIVLVLEEVHLMQKGTAVDIIGKGVMFIALFFLFPPLWDTVAYAIEGLSKYILNPSDPANAGANVQWIFTTLGGITAPEIKWDDILKFFTDPKTAGEVIFKDVFMSVFKAMLAGMLMFMLYLIGTIRIVLTAVLMIGMPIILTLSLFPFFKKVTSALTSTFVGLMLAPIFSSLAIVAGHAYILSADLSPLQEWLAAVAVAALAIFFPTITAPMLGSLVTSLTSMVTAAFQGGAVAAGSAIVGGARGVTSALGTIGQGTSGMGRPLSSLEFAKAAMSGGGLATIGKAAVTGAGWGLGSGLGKNVADVAKQFGLGHLGKIAEKASGQVMEMAPLSGKMAGSQFVSKMTGSVTEGLMPYLAMNPIPSSVNMTDLASQGKGFAAQIGKLANQGKYGEIADKANTFFNYPTDIHNKKAFGKAFADYVGAMSQSDRAIGNLYYNLNMMGEKGGVAGLKEDFKAIAEAKDFHRGMAAQEFGVSLPSSQFEASNVSLLPALQNPSLTYEQGYALKSRLAEAIEQAPEAGDVLSGTDIFTAPKGVEGVAARLVNSATEGHSVSLGLRKALNAETTRVIRAYDPETIGKISRIVEVNKTGDYGQLKPERVKTADTHAPIHVKRTFGDQSENKDDHQKSG